MTTPLATAFEIDEILDFHESSLRAWVRANQVGVLEIKKRGIQLDPATLRRRLKPAGPRQATLIISRTVEGTRAMVVTRVEGTQDQPS